MVENNTSSQSITNASQNGEPPEKRKWWATVLEWLPYPLAAALGYYAFDVEVRKSIYRNVAKHGFFNDLQKERNVPYEAILNKGADPGKSVAKELHNLEEKYRDEVASRFRNKLGMTNMVDYWQGIQRNQKISALVMGATVTSIVLGAAFLIKENEKLKAAFDRMARKKQDEAERS